MSGCGLINCGVPVRFGELRGLLGAREGSHVVFVRQFQQGAKPNAGYRISVDGQTMTVWELWARFRSELRDEGPTLPGHPHSA
jgi:hypothetical protein